MRILPFEISGFTYTHVLDGDPLDHVARRTWTELHNVAAESHRGEQYEACEVAEREICFAITDPAGDFYATWGLYRVRAIGADPWVVSALPAPMFPEIQYFETPPEVIDKFGQVANSEQRAEIQAAIQRFWRRTFATKEYMTTHDLPYEGGGALRIDHFRYPSVADGDPAQHRWMDRAVFDNFCKHTCEFDADDACIRTTGYKLDPPDPDRDLGSF